MTDTSPEALAALCHWLRDDSLRFPHEQRHWGADLFEALQAERDAAQHKADKWEAKWHLLKRDWDAAGLQYGECRADIGAEGARQERAAIVEYTKRLRHDEAFYQVCAEMDNHAARIERGEHLKGADHE